LTISKPDEILLAAGFHVTRLRRYLPAMAYITHTSSGTKLRLTRVFLNFSSSYLLNFLLQVINVGIPIMIGKVHIHGE
jgi:hypothetical protein